MPAAMRATIRRTNNLKNLYVLPVPGRGIKTAIFTVLGVHIGCTVYNIFLAFRYRNMRKHPATAPTAIPPAVAQNAHCSKRKLTVSNEMGGHNAISASANQQTASAVEAGAQMPNKI